MFSLCWQALGNVVMFIREGVVVFFVLPFAVGVLELGFVGWEFDSGAIFSALLLILLVPVTAGREFERVFQGSGVRYVSFGYRNFLLVDCATCLYLYLIDELEK